MKRVAFIDDEPEVLRGLERAMDLLTDDWDLHFFEDAQQVLDGMKEAPFDAVVTDMRMPGISGADVIDALFEQYPDTARIVLSGQSSREATFRAIHPMHLYLPKPCASDVLEETIDRALRLQELLGDSELKNLVHHLDKLPSKPELFDRIVAEMDSEEPSIRKIGELIQEDVAMIAKILQFANSARFGLRRGVNDGVQAAVVLGMETIRDFVLAAGVAMQYSEIDLAGFSLDEFCDRSLTIAKCAKAIAEQQRADKKTCEEAFTGGLLCDVGQLILIQHSAEGYQEVLTKLNESNEDICALEQEVFGCNHASVGAFALGSWGLSHSVVEAVGFHHLPDALRHMKILPVTAVHVAAGIESQANKPENTDKEVINNKYLASVGLDGQLATWMDICTT